MGHTGRALSVAFSADGETLASAGRDVGYVAVARGAQRRELDTGAQIVGSWCEGHGWQLTRLVHDVEPASGRSADRPGLAYALEQIIAGRVAGLVLAHLGATSGRAAVSSTSRAR